ncbi:MAG: (2Fe-2S)-binding protein [bacterium]|nr:(2Fe-2S)-binding protein [bacterium]
MSRQEELAAMMVCHCKAINSEFILRQFNQCSVTVDDLAKSAGVGMDCGACLDLIEDMLEQSPMHFGSTEQEVPVFLGAAS